MITPTEDEIESLLYRLVLGGLHQDDFLVKYNDEVGNINEEVTEAVHVVDLPRHGSSILRVLRGGLVIMEAQNGKMSLFETQARVQEREHLTRCAEFARGRWVDKVPTEAGCWPTRARDGRMSVHELKYSGGRLVDVSGGYVPAGKVSSWAGSWWSVKVPTLPGSY